MMSGGEANNLSNPSPHTLDDNRSLAGLRTECERLQKRVVELETERERDRQRLVELESERDHYRAEAYAWARKEFERKDIPSETELKRRIEQEDGVPLEGFLGELERTAKGS